jgi:hypothetical protein
MRRPPRNPFHHSDLGGPFLAFAPKFCDDDQDVTRGPLSDDHLPYPTRHQRSSILSLLIDALRYRRRRKPDTGAAGPSDGWSEAIPIATRTGIDGYRFAPPILPD